MGVHMAVPGCCRGCLMRFFAEPLKPMEIFACHVPGTTPPRRPNGGLYTGELFAGGWGNVPVVPEAGSIARGRHFHAYYQPSSGAPAARGEVPLASTEVVTFPEIGVTFPVTANGGCAKAPAREAGW